MECGCYQKDFGALLQGLLQVINNPRSDVVKLFYRFHDAASLLCVCLSFSELRAIHFRPTKKTWTSQIHVLRPSHCPYC